MTDAPAGLQEDVWSRWLLRHRSGGDAAFDQVIRSEVQGYVDRLLDEARLGAGMTLVDIGAGEGAVAFRAIERVGSSLRVILTLAASRGIRTSNHPGTNRVFERDEALRRALGAGVYRILATVSLKARVALEVR